MKVSAVVAGACAPLALGAKNVIFVVPDGMAPVSATIARTYLSMLEGGSPQSPNIPAIALDMTPVGNIRTHSSNNLVTDSAAAGTALAAGFKTQNGAIGVLPDGQPVGTILEAAKYEGYLTGLVVTSIINHATPAAFSAHVKNRNDFDAIAAQQIGHSHPLGQSVDVLLGGGRCYFRPKGEKGSCRSDNTDLFRYAKKNGYYVAQNREEFDRLKLGKGRINLPYLGLFTDNDMSYEADRRLQPKEEAEPSLTEMTMTALNALDRASRGKKRGYFMMIEASRIDHASHASDPVAHLHDVLEYNRVIETLTEWIDDHKDTVMISVADHETGGITVPSGFDPRPLQKAQHSTDYWGKLWDEHKGDKRAYLVNDILPSYGVTNPPRAVIDKILNGNFKLELANALNSQIGLAWSTGGHTAVDTVLYAYGAGSEGRKLKTTLAGSHDNTEIPRFIEKMLKVKIDKITNLLRKNWN